MTASVLSHSFRAPARSRVPSSSCPICLENKIDASPTSPQHFFTDTLLDTMNPAKSLPAKPSNRISCRCCGHTILLSFSPEELMASHKRVSEQNAYLKEKLLALKTHVEILQNQGSQLTGVLEKAQMQKSEIESLRTKIKLLEEAAIETKNEKTKEIESLQRELASKTADIGALQKALKDKETELRSITERHPAMESEKQTLSQRIHELQTANATLLATNQKQTQQIQLLEEQNSQGRKTAPTKAPTVISESLPEVEQLRNRIRVLEEVYCSYSKSHTIPL